jgi:Protein of unknown function (DUF3592)
MTFVGGVAFIALGVCLMVRAGVQLWLARGSSRWPSTYGTIDTAVVKEISDEPRRYAVAVSYTYAVGGTRYTGKRVHFGYRFGGEEQDFAEARRRKYEHGRRVTVRYSPDDPAESALETSISTEGLIGAFVSGIMSIAFGVSMIHVS